MLHLCNVSIRNKHEENQKNHKPPAKNQTDTFILAAQEIQDKSPSVVVNPHSERRNQLYIVLKVVAV